MTPEFGEMVREHRKRLGLTQARVAELVGVSAGEVRSWESGRKSPTQPALLSTLAAVLALNEQALFSAAGMAIPSRRPSPTIEQSLASIAPTGIPPRSGPESSPPDRRAGQSATNVAPPSPVAPAPTSQAASYVEDADQRLTYRLRGLFTAIGLVAALLVFAWAASNFLDAVGEAWDAFFGNL